MRLFARIPVAEATVKCAVDGSRQMEADGELVAVTETVPVVSATSVPKSRAVAVVVPTARVKRMEVAERIARATDVQTDIYVRDTHVRQRIVIAFDQYADGITRLVADDVHAQNVRIRRTAVRAAFDVDADLRMLDGHITDFRLAAAVDGNTVGDHTSVDDTARQAIVASIRADVVERYFSAEADDGFRIFPVGSRLQHGVVGQLQINT